VADSTEAVPLPPADADVAADATAVNAGAALEPSVDVEVSDVAAEHEPRKLLQGLFTGKK
jgi:hypothetical protein